MGRALAAGSGSCRQGTGSPLHHEVVGAPHLKPLHARARDAPLLTVGVLGHHAVPSGSSSLWTCCSVRKGVRRVLAAPESTLPRMQSCIAHAGAGRATLCCAGQTGPDSGRAVLGPVAPLSLLPAPWRRQALVNGTWLCSQNTSFLDTGFEFHAIATYHERLFFDFCHS